jgi:hypothetical protein
MAIYVKLAFGQKLAKDQAVSAKAKAAKLIGKGLVVETFHHMNDHQDRNNSFEKSKAVILAATHVVMKDDKPQVIFIGKDASGTEQCVVTEELPSGGLQVITTYPHDTKRWAKIATKVA